MRLLVSESEIERRQKKLKDNAAEMDITATILFNTTNIFYLTNFKFIQTERPMALIMVDDKMTFLVPRMEKERVNYCLPEAKTEVYPEYPGKKHPMEYLKEFLKKLNLQKEKIGVDSDGAPGSYGYEGPAISEMLPDSEIVNISDIISDMMIIKSEEEISLIRESAKWANLAMRLLKEYTEPGLTENEISQKASLDATLSLVKTYGEKDKDFSGIASGVYAGFRGQIGEHSFYPHSLTTNAIIKEGDVLGTGAGPCIGGYHSELERTFIVGKPTAKQGKYFDLMCNMQEIVFQKIKPGIKCSDVDDEVTQFFKENDLTDYWMHHTGHSIGLQGHEPPFLDTGDETEIKPGMLFTVEPGIYIPEMGGFRHSDTIVITENGMEQLTFYPRDIKSCTIQL